MKQSLLEPIPELDLAAKLLDVAADAFLSGRVTLAAELLDRSNFPEIRSYAIRLVGKLSQDVHLQVRRPKCLPCTERDPARMPTRAEQNAIFARDGWRCRFCGIRVLCKSARSVLTKAFPVEASWTRKEFQRHSALNAMASSLDHVVPHGRGGRNEPSNFVTACYCCQFGRGEWTLEEMQLVDPRDRAPVVNSWDGLSRLVGMRR